MIQATPGNNPPTNYELFGIECNKGWAKLYQPLIDWIKEYNKTHTEDPIEITQIKEKFGYLRFYVSHAPEELRKLIREAEYKSSDVCEDCGSEEDVGKVVGSWIFTICHKCAVERAKIRPLKWRRNSDGKTYWVNEDGTDEPITNAP